MKPTTNHRDVNIIYRIDQAIDIINAARPIACQVAHQRLGFADTFKGFAVSSVYQAVDALQSFFVLRLPIHIGGPRAGRETYMAAHAGWAAEWLWLRALSCHQFAPLGFACFVLCNRLNQVRSVGGGADQVQRGHDALVVV